jgi:hypothetical protein
MEKKTPREWTFWMLRLVVSGLAIAAAANFWHEWVKQISKNAPSAKKE